VNEELNQSASRTVSSAASDAAQLVQEAAIAAQSLIDTARIKAESILHESKGDDERITRNLSEALRDVFGENKTSGRFIDVSRIPLICKSIEDIHEQIKLINDKLDDKFVTKEAFGVVQKIVFGAVGVILATTLGLVLTIAFGHHVQIP